MNYLRFMKMVMDWHYYSVENLKEKYGIHKNTLENVVSNIKGFTIAIPVSFVWGTVIYFRHKFYRLDFKNPKVREQIFKRAYETTNNYWPD